MMIKPGTPVLFIPPSSRTQRLYHRFRLHLSRARFWIGGRWIRLVMLFMPRCPRHPNTKLYKGWCSTCDLEGFLRELVVRQLRP